MTTTRFEIIVNHTRIATFTSYEAAVECAGHWHEPGAKTAIHEVDTHVWARGTR